LVLAFDPGCKNFAYACLNHKTLEIHKVGMLGTPLHNFNDKEQFWYFKRQIRYLFEIYKPTHVVIERFQNRGRFSGEQVELVSRMIGILETLSSEFFHLQTELITALTWKSYYRKYYVTDALAKQVLKEQYDKLANNKRKKKRKRKRKLRYRFEMEHLIESETLCEHEIDALGICLWKAEILRKENNLLSKISDKLLFRDNV